MPKLPPTSIRLVARASAQHFAEAACMPYQFGLSARAGTEALYKLHQVATEGNPRTTVLSVDALSSRVLWQPRQLVWTDDAGIEHADPIFATDVWVGAWTLPADRQVRCSARRSALRRSCSGNCGTVAEPGCSPRAPPRSSPPWVTCSRPCCCCFFACQPAPLPPPCSLRTARPITERCAAAVTRWAACCTSLHRLSHLR